MAILRTHRNRSTGIFFPRFAQSAHVPSNCDSSHLSTPPWTSIVSGCQMATGYQGRHLAFVHPSLGTNYEWVFGHVFGLSVQTPNRLQIVLVFCPYLPSAVVVIPCICVGRICCCPQYSTYVITILECKAGCSRCFLWSQTSRTLADCSWVVLKLRCSALAHSAEFCVH